MLGHDYTRRHNEIVRCLHFMFSRKYHFSKSRKIRNHSIQEVIENDFAEIKIDTRIKTDIKISHNRPDIFIFDKYKNEIILVEVGITSIDNLNKVENEKLRKYDILANELGLIYKCKTKIVPYVMTWEGVVSKYHKKYLKELDVPIEAEAYMQSITLRKTLELISLEKRRCIEEGYERQEEVEKCINTLCLNIDRENCA